MAKTKPTNWIDYDIDACRQNLTRCDDNIKTFEKAIEDEEAQKRNLRQIIRVLEEKQSGVPK